MSRYSHSDTTRIIDYLNDIQTDPILYERAENKFQKDAIDSAVTSIALDYNSFIYSRARLSRAMRIRDYLNLMTTSNPWLKTLLNILVMSTNESIKQNKKHIIDYLMSCFEKMNLSMALAIYEMSNNKCGFLGAMATVDIKKDVLDFTTVSLNLCFGDEYGKDEVIRYIEENWEYFNAIATDKTMFQLLQKTGFFERAVLLMLYAEINSKEIARILNYISRADSPFYELGKSVSENWVRGIKSRKFDKQMKNDWFLEVYKKYKGTEIVDLDIHRDKTDNLILKFDDSNNRFDIKRV